MRKPTQLDFEHLVSNLIQPFYLIERDMLVPATQWRNENDAEHSWSLGLMACAMAERIAPHLNLGKISQYALVHDLVEVFAGDTTPWDKTDQLASKSEREEAGLAQISRDYAAFPWISATIEEYESKSTEEARFVWAADKYLALCMRYLDKGEFYRNRKGITPTMFKKGMEDHSRKAQSHPDVAKYYNELTELFLSHPEFFASEPI